ncbi:MAG: hypothetical protein LBP68_04505, partial [Acidobacteriota bacterium]|nr:hypothetical protein [Acidobacteriota bacterium]
TKTAAIPENELNACRELVLAAVGYDEQRGDVVTVENVPFFDDTVGEGEAPSGPWYVRLRKQEYLIPAIKYVALLALFVLAYLFFARPLRDRVFQAIDSTKPAQGEAGEKQLAPGEVAGLPEGAAAATGEATATDTSAAAAASLPAAPESAAASVLSMEDATEEEIERALMSESESMDRGARRYTAIKKKLVEKAKKDPELVSQLLRSLMHGKA